MADDFSGDIAAIESIAAVPTILEVVCRTTGMGFAAVARVTEDRWIACGVRDTIDFGLAPGGELKLETTICNEIRQSGKAVVIDHVAENRAFRDLHTPALYGFQSYISIPIILPDGRFFGTLCAIDPNPAKLDTPEIVGMFKLFAELIAFHLDAHARIAASEEELLDERRTSELREQFIAVLGHDLRNPLASIDAGAKLLMKTPLNDHATSILGMVQTSVGRMAGLIENVLDFARGRLGGGVTLVREPVQLEPALFHVIAELQAGSPHRVIETTFSITEMVNCDRPRISQLFSNLLGNALTHGSSDAPVRVEAFTGADTFELSVSNGGEPIPPHAMERLFHPFARGGGEQSRQGLGLGLYIASEIARAHSGVLEADSTPAKTRFTFSMPLR